MSMTETLGRGRFETPRWLALALALVTVAIIVTSVVRIATLPAPASAGDRAPGSESVAVYPAAERGHFHHGLVVRAGRQQLYHHGEI
jgi:hypothetical protein